MAFSANHASSGLGRRRFGGYRSYSEMNVVPLVDVVLVLLIIFMLTAGAMEFGLEVQVPKVRQTQDSSQELPVVTITRDGEIFLGDKPANINSLQDEIRQRFPNATAVYLKADSRTIWDPIAQVVSELGLKKNGKPGFEVKVVTQTEDAAAKRQP